MTGPIYDGSVLSQSDPDLPLLSSMAAAFPLLLAVAKAHDTADHMGCVRDRQCDGCDAEALAMDALDTAYPDWRDWT